MPIPKSGNKLGWLKNKRPFFPKLAPNPTPVNGSIRFGDTVSPMEAKSIAAEFE
ncbi:MAG: hypothetical protein M1127_01535 [Patescibacteria group bacterium]|nr:hypothetical protein [Patescibacteria group bacterium]